MNYLTYNESERNRVIIFVILLLSSIKNLSELGGLKVDAPEPLNFDNEYFPFWLMDGKIS